MENRITLETKYNCIVPIPTQPNTETTLVCGTDIDVGCSVMYQFLLTQGCYYKLCDNSGTIIEDCTIEPVNSSGMSGGCFTVASSCASLVFCSTVSLSKSVVLTVADIISISNSLDALYNNMVKYNFNVEDMQQVINLYLELKGGSTIGITHSWDGTVLNISSAAGTSSADLVGPEGPPGKPGMYCFRVNEEGHLILTYEDTATAPDFRINDAGHLILAL